MGWKDWSYTKKGLVIGVIVGFISVVVNTLLSGLPGIISLGWLLGPFVTLTKCVGESCWGTYVIFGDITFLLLSVLIGYIIGKIKSRRKGVK